MRRYALSEGGRVEPKQVGRVTPCAPFCPGISRRARSDAPYPPSLRHYGRPLENCLLYAVVRRSLSTAMNSRFLLLIFSCLTFVLIPQESFAVAELNVSPKDLPRVPPTEPARALSTFRVKSGFKLDLVAAEPLV